MQLTRMPCCALCNMHVCVLVQEQVSQKKGKGKQQPGQQQAAGEEMMAE